MKLGVVGTGMVGSAAAYAIAATGVVSSIVLVDHNPALAAAQAADISDAMPFVGGPAVRAGDYDDLRGAGIVVLAAGVAQKPGESRLELLGRNAAIFAEIIDALKTVAPDAILLIATNPVDIMTAITTRLTDADPARVIGSGTILDTARFRMALSRTLKVSPGSIHAHVIGEHGDSEVLVWSSAQCGSMPLDAFAEDRGRPLDAALRAEIDAQVRGAAQTIIAGKGATWFGIGAGLARIVKAIVLDQSEVLTVSALTSEIVGVRDVCLSIPRIVSARGVEHIPVPELNVKETVALSRSASMLAELAGQVEL